MSLDNRSISNDRLENTHEEVNELVEVDYGGHSAVSHSEVRSRPFLKWAGGKRWLAPHLQHALPNAPSNYCEPFLGGGAMFFQVKPQSALLCDINEDLINTYMVLRDNPYGLMHELQSMHIEKQQFLSIRGKPEGTSEYRAARFIYLNKTAYNGLYRTNLKGEFNVPFGCKTGTVLLERELLIKTSQALQGTTIIAQDFENTLHRVNTPCLVFLDPPYASYNVDSSTFIRYGESLFRWSDQAALSKHVASLAKKGCDIVLTNGLNSKTLSLYSKKQFLAFQLTRSSSMSGTLIGRGRRSELLVLSKPLVEKLGGTAVICSHLRPLSCMELDLSDNG